MKKLLLVYIFCTVTLGYSQSYPGNVSTDLQLWLKADAGVTGTTPVTAWVNQTGTTPDAIRIGDAPDLLTDQVNFNPALDFDRGNDYLQINGGILGTSTFNDVWIYSVTKADAINNQTLLRETANSQSLAVLQPWGGNSYIVAGNQRYNISSGANTYEYNMWTHASSTSTSTPSGMRKSIAKNGAYLGAGNNNSSTITGNGSNLLIGGGWDNGVGTNNNLDSKVAEIIIYTSQPSALEQERVQSYLAIKYGLTKNSVDIVATTEDEADYFASDGTTILWDYSANTAYHNDVTGIGRDDDTELDQRKSKSSTNGSMVTIDKGSAFGTDKDYILWGNNNLDGTNTAVAGYTARTNKIWKVAVAGTPGAVSFSVDLSGIGFDIINSTASDFALLIDTDADFTAGASVHTTGATLTDGILSFTNVNFSTNNFFTIAGPVTSESPGNVATNLKLWLKADAGVTGASPVTAWANQTASTPDAIRIGDAPDLLTDQVNFNPALDFDRGNDYLQINGGIVGTDTFTDVWVYSVTKADNINNQTLLRESLTSQSLAVLQPWGGNSYIVAGNQRYNTGTGINNYEYNMWTHASSTSTSTPSGVRKSIAKNGAYLGAGNNNNSVMLGNGSNMLIGGGWDNGVGTNNNMDSKVAEIIIYNAKPTPLEQEQVQSYLAIKYGLTKNSVDIGATAEDEADYFASDGTTILWDYSDNTAYHNNVAGIGRDDDTGLDQRKSKSSNNQSIVTIDKGSAFGTDKDYILWGNNNALPGISNAVAGYSARTDRIWKVAVTGTPGSVSFSIDLAGMGFDLLNNTASDFALLIDTDTDFTTGASVHTTGATLTDGILSFTNASFANNDYFVVAGPIATIAPGSVTANLQLWLKADQGVTGTNPVTAWTNVGRSTPDAIQIGDAPDLLTNQVNFNPALDFDRGNDYLQINGGLLGTNTYTDVWVYSVTKADNINNQTLLRESLTSQSLAVLQPWGGNSYIVAGNQRYNTGTGINNYEYNMWTHASSTSTNTPSGRRKSIARNGAYLGAGNNNNSVMLGNGSDMLIGGGWDNGVGTNNNMDSKVAEIIVYNAKPTPLEQERVQSYLAIKYGLTKNSVDIGTTTEDEADYFASDGTTILWDYSDNTTYHNDVAGIGRDDNTALDQQKSKSSNNESIVTIDKGAAFGTDKDYILWGNNNAAIGTSSLVAGYSARTNKIWKVAVTGTPGTVNFSIDLSGMGFDLLNNTATDFALLIDTDADFTAGASVHTTGATLVDGVLSFTNVSFADGNFFTVAGPVAVIGPGNVTAGLQLWLKADQGVTGTNPVTAWTNVGRSTPDAIQIGAAPDLLTNQVNFNPALDFERGNDYLQINGGLLGTNTFTDVWVYSVSKADNINNQTLLRESLVSQSLAVLQPWGGNSYIVAGNQRYNTSTGGINTYEYNFWTHASSTSTDTPSGRRKSIARNGNYLGSGNNNNSVMIGNGSDMLIGGGWDNGLGTNNNMDSKVAEIIMYNKKPTPLEQERVQSYLAIKYGITKNSTDIGATTEDEADYFASDGTTILWDYSANTTYHNEVAGIGRDDDTSLDQQKSKSNSNLSIVTIDKGGAFANDKDYIIWGNNTLEGTNTNVTGYPGRTNRIWKVGVTGTPGLVSFEIDLSGIGFDLYNFTASDFALLTDTDTDFTTGSTVHTTGASLNNGILSFTDVSFSNNDFFVIAGPILLSAPGNVTENLQLWLKADEGVLGTTPVTAWENQVGSTPNAIQIGDAPDLLTDQVNFNPALDFNRGNDYLQINGGLLGTNTYTDVWVYSVTKADAINNQTLLRESLFSQSLAVLQPWGGNSYIVAGNQRYNTGTGVNTSEYNIWTHASSSITSTPSGTRKSIARNGNYLGSGNNNNSVMIGNESDMLIGGGWDNGLGTNNNLDSKVAEIIIYNGIPTSIEQERVQSYLAIKYGITKNSTDIVATTEDEADYFASDGTTILWDYSANTTYHNNVAGVGRDDDTELSQTRSRSSNTGSLVTINKGVTFSTDKDYILWGNNADTGIRAYTATTNYNEYTNRVWKTSYNGTPGTVIFSIELSSLGFDLTSSSASDFALLIDTNDDFTSGVTEHITGASILSGVLSFTDVDFTTSSNLFFAIAKKPSSPKTVITNKRVTIRVNN